jgi:hypothetical protein
MSKMDWCYLDIRIIPPDYTSDINGLNDLITNLQSQIDTITVTDCTSDINNIK